MLHRAIIHPEDIKAAIRKRHGTVAAFVQKSGLRRDAVTDFLRGRGANERTAQAIEQVLKEAAAESIKLDRSSDNRRPHRKIAGAK